MKSILDIRKSLVDAELIYNLSSLANSDNLDLLRSDWSNMALIHVLHLHVILFMFIIDYVCFGVYFLRDVSPIHTLSIHIYCTKKPSLVNW